MKGNYCHYLLKYRYLHYFLPEKIIYKNHPSFKKWLKKTLLITKSWGDLMNTRGVTSIFSALLLLTNFESFH